MERDNKKWFEDSIYSNPEYFKNFTRTVYFKKDRGRYTVSDLMSLVKSSQFLSSIKTSEELPSELIPYGRKGTKIDTDYTFYRYAKDYLKQNEESKVFYINCTGHAGPVAAALAEKDVPLCWAMDLSQDNIAEERVIEQLQDYAPIIKNNGKSNDSCLGLILEPPHGFQSTIPYEELPNPETIKQMGMNKVVVFSEDKITGEKLEKSKVTGCIKKYLDSLKKLGMKVEIIGIDCRTSEKKEHFDFTTEKEHIDPKEYADNFTISTKQIGMATLHEQENTMDKRTLEMNLYELLKNKNIEREKNDGK